MTADSEKITFNLGHVDLGQVDPLGAEGSTPIAPTSSRCVRCQLDRHAVKPSVAGHQLELGAASGLAAQAARETLHVQVLGLAVIASEISAELARDTIASIHMLGALHANAAVQAALGDRIR